MSNPSFFFPKQKIILLITRGLFFLQFELPKMNDINLNNQNTVTALYSSL